MRTVTTKKCSPLNLSSIRLHNHLISPHNPCQTYSTPTQYLVHNHNCNLTSPLCFFINLYPHPRRTTIRLSHFIPIARNEWFFLHWYVLPSTLPDDIGIARAILVAIIMVFLTPTLCIQNLLVTKLSKAHPYWSLQPAANHSGYKQHAGASCPPNTILTTTCCEVWMFAKRFFVGRPPSTYQPPYRHPPC